MKIEAGKTIPADGLLLAAKEVVCDESAMTGESHEVKKDSLKGCLDMIAELAANDETITDLNSHTIPSPVLLSGTKITQGEGHYLIIAVGDYSAMGKLMGKTVTKTEASPLQKKLETIAQDVGKLGFMIAIGTVLIMLLRFIIIRLKDGGWDNRDINTCFSFLLTGLTIFVVAIPEGLPLAVTIALAYSVGRMYVEKNYVKNLMSCETMGGATTICSDKTGTLTENKMRILQMFVNGKSRYIDEKQLSYVWESDVSADQRELILEGICCNTTATKTQGDATEKAFVEMVEKFGVDVESRRQTLLGNNKYERFFFNSKRKKMSTIIANAYKANGKDRLYIKGASELLINCCDRVHTDQGVVPLTAEGKALVDRTTLAFNKGALRTLAVAYRDLEANEHGHKHDAKDPQGRQQAEESHLVLVALFGIRDTIRQGVRAAVDICTRAGIKVRMVTGDNKTTATAIAKECHILPEDFDEENDTKTIFEGPRFAELLGGLMEVCEKCNKEECSCQ